MSSRKTDKTVKIIISAPPLLFLSLNIAFLLTPFHTLLFSVVRVAYAFNTIYLPAILTIIGVYALVIRRSRRSKRWLLRISIIYFIAALLLFGLRIYASHIEPYRLVLREVEIKTSKVSRPVRILHLSDIQSGAIGKYEKRVFERIRTINPDLILYTGDLLQPVPPATLQSEVPKISELFSTLHTPLGMLGVYGNIDRSGVELLPIKEFGGLKMLSAKQALVTFGDTRLNIFGMSELGSYGVPWGRPRVEKWLKSVSSGDFTILMGHWPNFIFIAKDLHIDLCLAGHTHGGQIRLPFYGPILTLSNIPRRYALGYHEFANKRMNISGGIGCERSHGLPPIRINCPPEMTIITLKPM